MQPARTTSTPLPRVPRSVLFEPPGRPVDAAFRHAVGAIIREALQEAVAGSGFDLVSADDGIVARGRRRDLGLSSLGDLLETALKRTLACLDADLIGGANVTRLDRTVTLGHARLPYRKAVRIANGRGWNLALGEEIPPAAQETLIRFCGLLPVQVLALPGQPHPASLAPASQGLSYLLPLCGETFRAEMHEAEGDRWAAWRVDLARLTSFCLGLAI